MSSNSESATSHDYASASSTYDMGFGDSNSESSSSLTDQYDTNPKDYWFGKIYFESFLAQILLQHTGLSETVADIDSNLESVIRLYPYHQSLQKMKVQGLAECVLHQSNDVREAYQQMLTCVGAIVRNGTREERQALFAVLREKSEFGVSETHQSEAPNTGRGGRNGPQLQRSGSDRTLSNTSLGQYATALQEHAAQRGFAPLYKVHNISTMPSKFRATVSFEDSSFDGIDRNQKQARHQAARKACEFLGIEV